MHMLYILSFMNSVDKHKNSYSQLIIESTGNNGKLMAIISLRNGAIMSYDAY
jgi:hypothetical protein